MGGLVSCCQAVPIELAGVRAKGGEWTEEAKRLVKKKADDQTLKAKVVNCDKFSAVLDVKDTNGMSFTKVSLIPCRTGSFSLECAAKLVLWT